MVSYRPPLCGAGRAEAGRAEGEEEPVANGEVSSEEGGEKAVRKVDIIIITGKPEKCEAARKALLVSRFRGTSLLCHKGAGS